MNPSAIDTVQITHDSLPTVAATAPIENNTRGGTPLATQNAPVQSMPRSSPVVLTVVSTVDASAVELMYSPCAARRIQRGRGDPVRECSRQCAARRVQRGRSDP